MAKRNRNKKDKVAPQQPRKAKGERRKGPSGVQGKLINSVVPRAMPVYTGFRRNFERLLATEGSGLKPVEVAFLKAAFAPMDFQQLGVEGVPDVFCGPSYVRQEVGINTITIPAGQTYLIAQLPVPGQAYFLASTTSGASLPTTQWSGTAYSSYGTMFGTVSNNETSNALAYRFIGQSLELRPQSAVVSNAGLLICAKQGITRTIDSNIVTATGEDAAVNTFAVPQIDMTGCSLTTLSSGPCYTGHPNDGLYSCSFNTGSWEFEPIWEDVVAIPPLQVGILGTTTLSNVTPTTGQIKGDPGLPGFSNNHESIVVAITNSGASSLAMTIECRQTVEYRPNLKSVLYAMCTPSPAENYDCMRLYCRGVAQMPIAVGYAENATFWETMKKIWRGVLAVGSAVPFTRPLAMGLSAATDAGEALFAK